MHKKSRFHDLSTPDCNGILPEIHPYCREQMRIRPHFLGQDSPEIRYSFYCNAVISYLTQLLTILIPDMRQLHEARNLLFRRVTPLWFYLLASLFLLQGCTTTGREVTCDALSPSAVQNCAEDFPTYRERTSHWLQQQRLFLKQDRTQEMSFNLPSEIRPATPNGKGILLVHGLGDSPWSFTDVAQTLAAQGFLVRTMLLPGHGTKPQDMQAIHIDDWVTAVSRQVALLSKDVPEVYLGGFSTGANLVTSYAIAHKEIRGLVLFSPAFRVKTSLTWLLPLVNKIRPWFRDPAGSTRPQLTEVRYLNMPTNGLLQFHYSSTDVRDKLSDLGFDRPAILIMTEHDSVVDAGYIADTFHARFHHPDSRLIWYGTTPQAAESDQRIIVRPDYLPEQRISQFSHMGLLFSPGNPMYGRNGARRFCSNGLSEQDRERCMRSPETEIWYADWGYQEEGKLHARLTFNPYFEWQSEQIVRVLTRPLP